MLFLHGEDGFHQTSGGGIVVAKIIDHIAVAIDGDTLRDQILSRLKLQLGRGPGMKDAEAGDISRQTRFCLEKIQKVLRAANSDLSRLLKVNITIVNMDDWPAVNAVYSEMLGAHRPARAVIAAKDLHFGALIEIEAIAAA